VLLFKRRTGPSATNLALGLAMLSPLIGPIFGLLRDWLIG
jgi:hypothetical protein